MISPSTPPGTKIVCINTDVIEIPMPQYGVIFVHTSGGLVLGAEYTLASIGPVMMGNGQTVPNVHGVVVSELPHDRFLTHRFRRRDLPESLTRLQTALRKPAPALG